MTQADIENVTRKFVDTARLMADSGFSGVELHGAHGYLIGTSLWACGCLQDQLLIMQINS